MIRVYVSPFKLRNGQWSKRRIVWASFHSRRDAELFIDKLHTENPTWVIETKDGGAR